jgi:uncharacterized RDD family membrane protein YckC
VDVNRIIERSNLEEIISRASSGVFSEFVDMARTRIAFLDQWGQRFCRLRCFSKRPYLPPRPGRPQDDETVWPKRSGLRARKFGMAVQFRTCGGLCRVVSRALDILLLAITFAGWSYAANYLARVFINDPNWTLKNERPWIVALIYTLYCFTYEVFMLGCFGRTIGMWVLGLLMVSRDGHRLDFPQVVVHTVLIPLNAPLFGWVLVRSIVNIEDFWTLSPFSQKQQHASFAFHYSFFSPFCDEMAKCGMSCLPALPMSTRGRSKPVQRTKQTLP